MAGQWGARFVCQGGAISGLSPSLRRPAARPRRRYIDRRPCRLWTGPRDHPDPDLAPADGQALNIGLRAAAGAGVGGGDFHFPLNDRLSLRAMGRRLGHVIGGRGLGATIPARRLRRRCRHRPWPCCSSRRRITNSGSRPPSCFISPPIANICRIRLLLVKPYCWPVMMKTVSTPATARLVRAS